MREILFRAKRIDSGEWVVGQYTYILNPYTESGEPIKHLICNGTNIFNNEIDPETLCQYTGLKDKNGKRVWENDIFYHQRLGTFGKVVWIENDEYIGWAAIDKYDGLQCYTKEMFEEVEIIGNIFDNAELVKGE